MALIVADRVQETTTTTGTGTYTLAGAKDGFQSFAAVGDGNTTYYACTDGTDYEVGIGTFTLSGTTLARTTIIESSNSDAAVNWGAGSKDIFVTAPADKTLLMGRNLYADNPSSPTAPSVTGTNAVAIGSGAISSGSGSVALGLSHASGTSSFAAANNYNNTSFGAIGAYSVALGNFAKASTTNSVAIGQGATSTGNAAVTISASTSGLNGASGAVATAIGGNSSGNGSNATGTASMALGGSYASGTDSFAAAITNNTSTYGATGANSVAMGYRAKATASDSFCIADTSTASGIGASVLGGQSSTASGSNSTTIGGGSNTASGDYSTAKGYYGNANGIRLKHATGVYPNQQGAYYVMGYTTSDATPIALNTSVWTPSSTNQIVLPNNSAYAFHGTIVARQQASGGTASAAWKVEGLIRREGSAGTTVLVNSATTVIDNTPSWGMALSADTTNGGLKIEATGAAATNIRWVATIHTSEVTYA